MDISELYRGVGTLSVSPAQLQILELHYRRGLADEETGEVRVVFGDSEGERKGVWVFKGVKVESLLCSEGCAVEIVNQRFRQWESPRAVGIWLVDQDGSRELLFSAHTVEEESDGEDQPGGKADG